MRCKTGALLALGIGVTALAVFSGVAAFADDKMHHPAAQASATERSGLVEWDAAASRSLEAELHRLHDIWNTGNIAALNQYVIGDAVLPTFELDPRTHRPIKLDSKGAIDDFIVQNVNTQADSSLVTELEHPAVRCRATATWGICTEECSVRYKRDGETVAIDKLWSTQIAVMTDKGWRWIQWHMSNASPPASPFVR